MDLLVKTAIHSMALLLAALITWHVIQPLQDYALGASLAGTLIFLPFGVKVISAFFEGWRSVLLLMPGAIAANAAFWQLPFDEATTWLAIVASYSIAPACFSVADVILRQDRRETNAHLSWRLIILCGLASSILGALLLNLILSRASALFGRLDAFLSFAIGDFLGLIAVLSAVTLAVRLWRLR